MDEVVYRSVGIICIVENVRDDIHRREEDAFRRFEDHLGVMTVGSRSLATIGGGGGGVFGDEVIQIDLC